MKLLTQNAKLKKDPRYNIWGLDIAPHTLSGYNVCKHAGLCAEVCVGEHSGLNQMPTAKQAKINKAKMLFENPTKFYSDLHWDLNKLNNSDDDRKKLCRLNVDSDIPYFRIDSTLFTNYKNITFYDYSKYINTAIKYVQKKLPSNYQISYSFNEKSDIRKVNYILKNGGRINVVASLRYRHDNLLPIPKKVKIGTKIWKTVDGDKHDARIDAVDGKGKVVIVRAKTKKSLIPRYVEGGFFMDLESGKSRVKAV